jgi:hypothetical protein
MERTAVYRYELRLRGFLGLVVAVARIIAVIPRRCFLVGSKNGNSNRSFIIVRTWSLTHLEEEPTT